ncbi:hypothetical protein [Thalassotalea sp. G20_0]|uniref:hypothetical protein n=1 Tax=Thalassotalea sp. G20_0 TaxID=2821093 RepID=UPI002570C40D|nr:hypothetical protein [Thalassotalea sp. G20_0]
MTINHDDVKLSEWKCETIRSRIRVDESGSRVTLLSPSPLRTVLATFTAYGSSLKGIHYLHPVPFDTIDAPIDDIEVDYQAFYIQLACRAMDHHVERVLHTPRNCSAA